MVTLADRFGAESAITIDRSQELGTKKTGKGRRKVGRKKRRMRAKIRHRKK